MNLLGRARKAAYPFPVLAHSGAGRGNPLTLGASALLMALFLCVAPQWRAMQGHRKVCRVPSSRFSTPASFATLAVERDVADSRSTRSNPL